MLKIDTSVITPTAGYPGLANNTALGRNPGVGLDFIQSAIMQIGEALSLALAANLDPAAATILVNIPHVYGTGYMTGGVGYTGSGYVYYGGEIFYYPDTEFSTISSFGGGGTTYLSASWVPNPVDTGSNQTTLSDGATIVSMHNQRTIVFATSTTANSGNLPDYANWVTSQVAQNTANIATVQQNLGMVLLGSNTSAKSNAVNLNKTTDTIVRLNGGTKFLITDIVMANSSYNLQNAAGAEWWTGGSRTGMKLYSFGTISDYLSGPDYATAYLSSLNGGGGGNSIAGSWSTYTQVLTGNLIYFSLTNAEGHAATCDMYVYGYIIG